jgi:alpha-L-fucosidase
METEMVGLRENDRAKHDKTIEKYISHMRLIRYLFILFTLPAAAQYQPTWESIDKRPVPTWFTDAKFGIFIHWGLYSVPSWAPTDKNLHVYSKYAEWYWYRFLSDTGAVGKAFRYYHNTTYGEQFKYQDFADQFRAELFKPDQWADLFTASGAKYVVLTSKHHEGFTLWPSRESWNWNSVDVGPHRDLAGDLIKAVKAKGLRMGYYYSLYEWFSPLYKTDVNRYVNEHMLPQMKDLVNRYHPDIFWTDGEWDHPSHVWKSTEFLAWLYNESPVKEQVVVNDRWGKETRSKHGGIYTTEYDLVHDANTSGSTIEHPWEECRGIGSSFGLNRAETLDDYSTSEQLIHVLIDKVARGGNLLLDIGPAADGTIPVIMQQRLLDMGQWLKVNGEAIYGTTSWKQAPKKENIFFTKKGNAIYVLCTKFPTAAIVVENIGSFKNVSMLGYKGVVKATANSGKLTITPPVITPANNPCSYAWVFKLAN